MLHTETLKLDENNPHVNALVKKCTAFASLSEMLKSMREHSYVPTLRERGASLDLALVLEAAGFKVHRRP